MAPRKPKTRRASKRKDTIEQVEAQIDEICRALEGGGVCAECAKLDPKLPSPCPHNELSTTQHATMIRELRQFLRLRSQLESAAPVDEHKLATSEVYQATVKRLVAAVKDCDHCTASVLKALKADV